MIITDSIITITIIDYSIAIIHLSIIHFKIIYYSIYFIVILDSNPTMKSTAISISYTNSINSLDSILMI